MWWILYFAGTDSVPLVSYCQHIILWATQNENAKTLRTYSRTVARHCPQVNAPIRILIARKVAQFYFYNRIIKNKNVYRNDRERKIEWNVIIIRTMPMQKLNLSTNIPFISMLAWHLAFGVAQKLQLQLNGNDCLHLWTRFGIASFAFAYIVWWGEQKKCNNSSADLCENGARWKAVGIRWCDYPIRGNFLKFQVLHNEMASQRRFRVVQSIVGCINAPHYSRLLRTAHDDDQLQRWWPIRIFWYDGFEFHLTTNQEHQ